MMIELTACLYANEIEKNNVTECMEKCRTGKNGWDLCIDGDTDWVET